jgi:hypothetical protein
VGKDGFGPLQLIVIDFHSAVLPPLAHAQVDDLRRSGVIRLVDSLVATKEGDGRLIVLETLDAPRSDPVWNGVLAQGLFGSKDRHDWNDSLMLVEDPLQRTAPELGVTEEQLLEVADLIPTNARVLILLIEHLWTSELGMAAAEAEGHVLANCWISPTLLTQTIRRGRALLS